MNEYRSSDLKAFEAHKNQCIHCNNEDLNEAHLLHAGSGWRCSECGLTVINKNGESGTAGVKLEEETLEKYSLTER